MQQIRNKILLMPLTAAVFLCLAFLGCDSGDVAPGGCSSGEPQTDTGSQTLELQENSAGFCRVDGTIDNDYSGFTGNGFANTTNMAGSGIQWAVEAETAGACTLTWRYANGSAAFRPGRIVTNGSGAGNVDFSVTGAWDSWMETAPVRVMLRNGINRISLQATGTEGLANIDLMTVSGGNLFAGDCNAAPPGGDLPHITIWIAGDSTVANGSSSGCPVGWGRSFSTYFNDKVTVENYAVGGRSVRTWLYDVQSYKDASGECVLGRDAAGNPTLQQRWQTMLANMQAGDYLLIQFGINDGDPNCPRHVGSRAFKESYGMMAQAAKARGVNPVFITPVSAIACNGSTAVASRGFITETVEAGRANNVPVIDLHARSIQLYNSKRFCPVPGGDVTSATIGPVGNFFCDDHTHFSASGALEIGGLVAQALRESNVRLAQYLK